jgi:hypothetical protein
MMAAASFVVSKLLMVSTAMLAVAVLREQYGAFHGGVYVSD